MSDEAKTDVLKKPEVPVGKLLVTATQRGYINAMDVEPGEIFTIPLEPVNQKTGLPLAYSDYTKPTAPGRNGWMKPFDAVEAKKLVDMKIKHEAKKKGDAPPAPAAPAAEPQADAGSIEGEVKPPPIPPVLRKSKKKE